MPLRIVGCRDFLSAGSVEPAPRLEGLAPVAGVVPFIGPAHSGKSRLVCAFIAAVDDAVIEGVQSTTFLGRRLTADVGSRGAVIVAGEHTDASWRALIFRAARGRGLNDLTADVVRPKPTIDLTDDRDFDELVELVERQDPWLVALDSLRALHRGDENASADMREVMRRASLLAGERRLVVPVHHSGGNGLPRGSTDFAAACDGMIQVSRTGDRLVLRARSHDTADAMVEVRMVSAGDGGFAFEPIEGAPPSDDDERRRRDAILAALESGALSSTRLLKKAREVAKNAGGAGLGKDKDLLATAKTMAGESSPLIVEDGTGRGHVWRRTAP